MFYRKPALKLFVAILLLSCTNPVVNTMGVSISGKVIAVKDGDTIEILYEGKPLAIRFAHVDCPEIRKSQPFGKASKLFTSNLCFGQTVTVINDGKFDRYKRLIAVVLNEKKENVNKELVKAGLAWHFMKYSTDMTYTLLEQEARQNKVGLWKDQNPVAPWEWGTAIPNFVLPVDAVEKESLRWLEKPSYNRVFVSGQEAGVLAQVTRSGTAGDLLAPMVVDALITEAAVARQRGLAVLSDTGRQIEVSLNLPVLLETGIIEPGAFVQYRDGGVDRIGLVRSTQVQAGFPEVWQTLGVQTYA